MIDELWPGGPRFIRRDDVFQLGTDSVLLASFAGGTHAKAAFDLGCGGGILAILLAYNNPKLRVDAVEIQPHAVALTRENVALGGFSGRISVTEGDLRRHRELFTAGAYDLVVSNPPYFPRGSGKTAESESLALCRDERSCSLRDICDAAAYLTCWDGKFALVHRPERLAEVVCSLSAAGMEPKRLRFVQHKAASAPSLFLLESRRGGKTGLDILPPLILADADGGDTDEVKQIYHRR